MATPIRNLMKTCAAIALAAQNLFAHDGTEWIGDVGWNYTVENGEATISNAVRPNPDLIPGIGIYYGPAGGDLVVPATVGNGIPVTTVMGAGGNDKVIVPYTTAMSMGGSTCGYSSSAMSVMKPSRPWLMPMSGVP